MNGRLIKNKVNINGNEKPEKNQVNHDRKVADE